MTVPRIRAVLWDIDGTLLDSEPWHKEATLTVSADHGYQLSEADYAATLGIAYPEFYARLDAVRPMPVDFKTWVSAIGDRYLAQLALVQPRPGAFALVEDFARRGVLQACVSNSGRRVVEANLKAMAIAHFAFAICRDDVTNGKPDPEPYQLAARRLGVAPAHCVVIEDSPTGCRSAKAAGMLTVAWPQSAHAGSHHAGFEAADHIVTRLDELDWDGFCGAIIEPANVFPSRDG